MDTILIVIFRGASRCTILIFLHTDAKRTTLLTFCGNLRILNDTSGHPSGYLRILQKGHSQGFIGGHHKLLE